jgi:hypothetical protein
VALDPKFVSDDTPPISSRTFLLRLLNNLRQVRFGNRPPRSNLGMH